MKHLKKPAKAEIKTFKVPARSQVIKTEVVCSNDTNPMGILQGGRLVQWMDIAAAVCAQTHAGTICVTASIDTVSFIHPARVGDIVSMNAKITRAFTTSMEIRVQAWTQCVGKVKKEKLSESYFTFVALDEKYEPTLVKPMRPVSANEKKLFTDAGKRKSKR
ncbi:MAG TPA: acyl-CoA thioesterase [Cyclobacteriaceae bacterium]|nr:acyl-CoA thioesterase [Cyclobacteriaceae bacterium]